MNKFMIINQIHYRIVSIYSLQWKLLRIQLRGCGAIKVRSHEDSLYVLCRNFNVQTPYKHTQWNNLRITQMILYFANPLISKCRKAKMKIILFLFLAMKSIEGYWHLLLIVFRNILKILDLDLPNIYELVGRVNLFFHRIISSISICKYLDMNIYNMLRT